MLMEHLLPSPRQLEQRDWHINEAHHQIEGNVASTQYMALCPVCHQPSARIHSGYERTLQDLNWADWGVTLRLSVHNWTVRSSTSS